MLQSSRTGHCTAYRRLLHDSLGSRRIPRAAVRGRAGVGDGRRGTQVQPRRPVAGRETGGLQEGQSARYANWFDDEEWHVRTTSGEKGPHAFAGMIEIIGGKMTSMTIVGIEAAKKKEADAGTWNAQKTMFKFTLKTGKGHTDGFDLKVSDKAAALKFILTAGGDEAPAKV